MYGLNYHMTQRSQGKRLRNVFICVDRHKAMWNYIETKNRKLQNRPYWHSLDLQLLSLLLRSMEAVYIVVGYIKSCLYFRIKLCQKQPSIRNIAHNPSPNKEVIGLLSYVHGLSEPSNRMLGTHLRNDEQCVFRKIFLLSKWSIVIYHVVWIQKTSLTLSFEDCILREVVDSLQSKTRTLKKKKILHVDEGHHQCTRTRNLAVPQDQADLTLFEQWCQG